MILKSGSFGPNDTEAMRSEDFVRQDQRRLRRTSPGSCSIATHWDVLDPFDANANRLLSPSSP